MTDGWRRYAGYVGRVEKAFLGLLALWAALAVANAGPLPTTLATTAAVVCGAWCAIRLVALGIRRAIWRLRNRLYVTYVFIAIVPVLLILVLAQLGTSFLAQQIGVYLVNSELDRRLGAIRGRANAIARVPPAVRADVIRRTGFVLRDQFPGLEIVEQERSGVRRYPEDSTLQPPPTGWGTTNGLLAKEGLFHAWAHVKRDDVEVTIVAPVTRIFLLNLVPNLGNIDMVWWPDPDRKSGAARRARLHQPIAGEEGPAGGEVIPPPVNRLDQRVLWGTPIRVAIWDSPGTTESYILSVHTRISAILGLVFSQQSEQDEQGLLMLLYLFVTLFLLVELISLIIGVSLTRTITSAVQALYEGTLRIKEGDLSHRIQAQGNDQLADLALSFNTMTENLQRLVVVEKERERLHAELEIAREVQDALHPRVVPNLKTLTLTAGCNAARMVSGDYYDYQMLGEDRVAIAVGDVAGKGISAALLMATVQSSFRTQIRACRESAVAAPGGNAGVMTMTSTAELVTQLNQQLYEYTAAEKFATFLYAIYDDRSGLLTYTNAGHLPPLIIRDGQVLRLEINGMVVGAFPFARYGESRIQLIPGDLLVCFTDGITEPENEYGEMFAEDRLADVLVRNARRDEQEIIDAVMEAVGEWTGSPELQDDMTLLLARKQS